MFELFKALALAWSVLRERINGTIPLIDARLTPAQDTGSKHLFIISISCMQRT